MILNFARDFEKQRKKLAAPAKEKLNDRLRIFSTDPFHPLLNNHQLHGEYAGCRSINITGDYRAIFYHQDENTARFIAIGTHHELFGS